MKKNLFYIICVFSVFPFTLFAQPLPPKNPSLLAYPVGMTPSIAFTSTSSNGLESVSSADLQVDLSYASSLDVTVDYTVSGTATGSGTDYTLADGTLTITAGNTSGIITISGIVDDDLNEGNETVIVTLSNPVNVTLGTNTVYTYTITDNDISTNLWDISKSNVFVQPNPFVDVVSFYNLNSDLFKIIITDLSGRIVFNTRYQSEKSINLDNLSSGIYLLAIVNNVGEKQVFKIVKE
ncbi:MAG: Calx-beta domain-containing protein [Paludibacter sp.]|nr:Calx-beta domain-containing protein [Paludibacter sp.]